MFCQTCGQQLPTTSVRGTIATLSTSGANTYYESVVGWYRCLTATLEKYGLTPEGMAPAHRPSGRGYVDVTMRTNDEPTIQGVWYTWYRMPSGRMEIVCGPC